MTLGDVPSRKRNNVRFLHGTDAVVALKIQNKLLGLLTLTEKLHSPHENVIAAQKGKPNQSSNKHE
jgi:hypothetical protein